MKKDCTGIIRKIRERSTFRTALPMIGAELQSVSRSVPSSPRPVVPLLIPAAYNLFMPRSGDRGMRVTTAASTGGAPCPQAWHCLPLHEDCKFMMYLPSRRDLPCCTRDQLLPQDLGAATTEREHFAESLQALSCRGKHRSNSTVYKPLGDTMHRSSGFPSLPGPKHRGQALLSTTCWSGWGCTITQSTTKLLYPCHSRAQRYCSRILRT